MVDQAEALRQMVLREKSATAEPCGESSQRIVQSQRRRTSAGVLLLVGPTAPALWLGLQLAVGWKRAGTATGVLEIGSAALANELGLQPKITWASVTRGERTLREALMVGPAGIDLVLGGISKQEDSESNELAQPTADSSTREAEFQRVMPQLKQLVQRRRVILPVRDPGQLKQLLPMANYCLFLTDATEDATIACYAQIKSVSGIRHDAMMGVARCGRGNQRSGPDPAKRLIVAVDRCLNQALADAGRVPEVPFSPWHRRHGGAHASESYSESSSALAVANLARRIEPRMWDGFAP